MEIRAFHRETELPMINAWLREREMEPWLPEFIPEIGFSAYESGSPVAIIFLRKCEGGVGMIDGLVTNPIFPAQTRFSAIQNCIYRIIDEAKKIGMLNLMLWTHYEGIISLSRKHEFKKSSATVMTLDLRK